MRTGAGQGQSGRGDAGRVTRDGTSLGVDAAAPIRAAHELPSAGAGRGPQAASVDPEQGDPDERGDHEMRRGHPDRIAADGRDGVQCHSARRPAGQRRGRQRARSQRTRRAARRAGPSRPRPSRRGARSPDSRDGRPARDGAADAPSAQSGQVAQANAPEALVEAPKMTRARAIGGRQRGRPGEDADPRAATGRGPGRRASRAIRATRPPRPASRRRRRERASRRSGAGSRPRPVLPSARRGRRRRSAARSRPDRQSAKRRTLRGAPAVRKATMRGRQREEDDGEGDAAMEVFDQRRPGQRRQPTPVAAGPIVAAARAGRLQAGQSSHGDQRERREDRGEREPVHPGHRVSVLLLPEAIAACARGTRSRRRTTGGSNVRKCSREPIRPASADGSRRPVRLLRSQSRFRRRSARTPGTRPCGRSSRRRFP